MWNYSPASSQFVNTRDFTTHTQPVNTLKAMWDGRVASGGDDKKIYIWDYSTGSASVTLTALYAVYALDQLSSKYIVAGYAWDYVQVWDITSSSVFRTVYAHNQIRALVTVSSTKFIACNQDGFSIVFDWVNSNSSSDWIQSGGSNSITDIAVTVDRYLVSVSSNIKTMSVFLPSSTWGLSGASTKCSTTTFQNNLVSVMALSANTYSRLII